MIKIDELNKRVNVVLAWKEGALLERCHVNYVNKPESVWRVCHPGTKDWYWDRYEYRVKKNP